MNKFIMGAAATALILSSCAKNDLLNGPDQTPNDGKIRFAASTGLNTKGSPFNTTGDLQNLGTFSVQGFVEGAGADLIGSDMKWTAGSSTWEYETGDAPYWPNTWMDFYGHANWAANALTIDPDGAKGIETATNVTIGQDVNGSQKDLLVAITPNATKEVRTLLTFKHALTQIVFKAGNVNPTKIDVKIGGVELVNINNSAAMQFKKGDSKPQWTLAATTDNYAVDHIGNTIADGFAVPSATAGVYSTFPRIQTKSEPDNNALMLIPQEFNAWDPTSGTVAGNSTDSYIKLTVLITKKGISAATADKAFIYAGSTDGAEFSYGTVYIPVESKAGQAGLWEAGKRINYIISFGDYESGSGGAGYDADGNPILIPIKFRAVVEDWTEVNVPLLSANIAANSSAITHEFINGFTNQLLNDVKAAPAPKAYKAKVTFTGSTSATIAATTDHANKDTDVTFEDLIAGGNTQQNAKFLPGSTLTYDMSTVDFSNGNASIRIPAGWVSGTNVAGGDVTVTTAGSLVLTKLPVAGYDFVTLVNYLSDNLNALELNENGASTTPACGNTVFVTGEVKTANFVFSCDPLAKLIGADAGKKVTIDLTAVTFTNPVTTWCPAGWTAQIGGAGTTFNAGEPIKVSAANTIVFTKTATNSVASYRNLVGLQAWLATGTVATPVSGHYYYDNVDFDVVITEASLFAGNTYHVATGTQIHLKYPVSAITLTGWTYTATTGVLVKN